MNARVWHPESTTAADFRADPLLVADEMEALQVAEKLITPNSWVAETMGANAHVVPWIAPGKMLLKLRRSGRPRIYFPSGALARRGAFEIQQAMRFEDWK